VGAIAGVLPEVVSTVSQEVVLADFCFLQRPQRKKMPQKTLRPPPPMMLQKIASDRPATIVGVVAAAGGAGGTAGGWAAFCCTDHASPRPLQGPFKFAVHSIMQQDKLRVPQYSSEKVSSVAFVRRNPTILDGELVTGSILQSVEPTRLTLQAFGLSILAEA
jgi:hypothetical protein